jgi:DNA-binding LytR/AlgR family response regulator
MFRIALCDDNHAFLEYEYNVICRYMTERNIEFQCNIFLSGQELLKSGEDIKKFNLFILDYDMVGLTGFDTASKIYEMLPNAKIAFATNYYDFTREGYKYNAVRYLVKQEKTFIAELQECIEFVLKTVPPKMLLLELSNGIMEVAVDDLEYIRSDKHYVEYFIKDKESSCYIRRCSLDDALEELPGYFIRVHQRYIVNLKKANLIKRNEIFIKKTGNELIKIPIARNRFDEVSRKFCLIKGEIG